MTDKISSLSKYEDVKKSYLQVGKKFRIPLDIIKYIFNIVTKEEKKEGKKQMIYLKNILLFRLIASPFDIEFHIFGGKKYEHKNPLQRWINKYNEINNWNGFYEETLYEYRIPDGKNCEWAIKTSPIRKKSFVNNEITFYDIREKLMVEIKILGEENYLMKLNNTEENLNYIAPADLPLKIKYLNTSPFNEIDIDYSNFLEWKGSDNERAWSMIIDVYGEATYQ